MTDIFIGVDVSKDWLDLHEPGRGTGAADVVFKALLYNHATGRSVPANVDQSVFQDAFRSKNGK